MEAKKIVKELLKGKREMKLTIGNLKYALTKATGRPGLILVKYSPEILMGLGIVGVVASTVMACKATLKVNEIIQHSEEDLAKVRKAHEVGETESKEPYSEEDYERDLTLAHVQRIVWLVKLYLPAALATAGSLALILGSHRILTKRNMALMAAYAVLDESFKKYRQNVIDELGPEVDAKSRFGKQIAAVIEDSKDAPEEKKKFLSPHNLETISDYARFYDENSTQWQRDPAHNLFFLKSQQNWANDLLNARGHVFLNEVYDLLGIPRSQAGCVVGWVKDSKRGDSYIDFGIYNEYNGPERDAVNGYNRAFLLDFNVDGVIYDLI